MAVYGWKGINAKGKALKGVRDAESPRALRALLKREGILVTEMLADQAMRQKRSREVDFGRMFRRVSQQDVAMTTRQLATLLQAGIPLVEALTALIDQLESEQLREAFTDVRDRVNEGTSLAESLRAHPTIFSNLYNSMVAAGEASGTLEQVLGRLSDFLANQAKLKSKVVGSLAYPAFMLVMGLGIIFLMMIVVVPKVTAIFEDFDQGLPWYTRVLIFFSDALAGWWWLILLAIFGGVYGFRRWLASPKGREIWDRRVLGFPLFGKLLLMVAVSRFSRTLSTLLASGVPVLRAMEITRNVLGNQELMRVIEEARLSVREGESIAVTLRKSKRFPPVVTHMIAIGERSGELEKMLEHVAESYDTQIEARLVTMTSLLEPIMIVLMGGFSGGIAFSILMPLLQINEFVK